METGKAEEMEVTLTGSAARRAHGPPAPALPWNLLLHTGVSGIQKPAARQQRKFLHKSGKGDADITVEPLQQPGDHGIQPRPRQPPRRL